MMQSIVDKELQAGTEPLLVEAGANPAHPKSMTFWELWAMNFDAPPRLPKSWCYILRVLLYLLVVYLFCLVPVILSELILSPLGGMILTPAVMFVILFLIFAAQLRRFRRLGAVNYVKKQIELNKCLFGADSPQVCLSYRLLGLVYEQQLDLEEALQSFKTITETSHQCKMHPNGAYYFHKVGSLLFALGRYGEALGAFQDALRLRKLKRNPYRITMELCCIANVYNKMGDMETALSNLNAALKELKDSGMKKCMDVAKVLVKIGSMQDSIGNYKEALYTFKEALDIYLLNLGELPRSNAVGQIYEKIAEVQLKIGDAAFAAENFQLAIEVYRRGGKSDEHEDVARLMRRLMDMQA